ncbi:hypothetical protein [Bradyrhizobium sp. Ash2021]|uniref:hypothetical protein n=1 Tax=Bradyrhizobium sp. Ash2021 TaxID=2954771 RepID=UPI002815CD3A|nr:hypothetical protein [Bradyrhizobium sp. Ash2021]WMT75072.1 hypothetical protein NL528_01110 [Bradyrhizobium sp. Ash2021]
MTLQLHNHFGVLDLSVIDPKAVSELDDQQQALLASLISAVQNREAAQARYAKAIKTLQDATAEQIAAMEAHITANPPQTAIEALRAAQAAYNASH